MSNQNWGAVPEGRARLIWKCGECGTEYAVDPAEATMPYCSNDRCRNAGEETEFERVEVTSETIMELARDMLGATQR